MPARKSSMAEQQPHDYISAMTCKTCYDTGWQFLSDISTERAKRFGKRQEDVSETLSETALARHQLD
jgi:hypothetical protein